MKADAWSDLRQGRSRQNGAYATQKLTFFNNYLPGAFDLTRRKVTKHYVDLFAGPGVWQDERGIRRRGSPLEALSISARKAKGDGFTEAYLVNYDPQDHHALEARIDLMVDRGLTDLPRERIHTVLGDANSVVNDIMQQIHPKSWVFVYADIEKPSQWPWTTVEALHSQGHESVDLYLLFPLHMALRRVLGFTVQHSESATRFFGCDDWRTIVEARETSAHSKHFIRRLRELYERQLQQVGWRYVNRQRRVADRGRRWLYYMLFATDHDVAHLLADFELLREQRELFG